MPPSYSALVAAVVGTVASQPPARPIAMFRGNPAHTGDYHERTGPELAGLQWRFDTDGSVIGSPAVIGDTVWIGSSDGFLYALDRVSGRLRWKVGVGAPIASTPAVTRGRIIVMTMDGSIVALESATGARLWRLATGPLLPFPWGHESGDLWTSSPVVVGDLAVVGAGDGRIYAVDVATGRTRWKAATEGRVRSTPAIDRGRVFVGSADGYLYCFDLATGARRWRFATDGVELKSGSYGFDRRTIQSSPAVAGNTVYIGARDGLLYAVSADSGTLRWRFDHRVSWVNGSPAVAGGVVYVGSSDAQFFQAVDAASGKELWRTATAATVWSSAAISGDLVIVGDGSGKVRAFDRKTGAARWAFSTNAQAHSSPVPAGSLVITGSADGGVYAIRTDSVPTFRAVFIDTAGATKALPAEAAVARLLTGRDYRPLGGAELVSFLEARLADRAPSVVVFAMDDLPAAVATEPLDRSLLRRYLDSGGKIVWTRVFPPQIWPIDPSAGKRTGGLGSLKWDDPSRILGMKLEGGIFDQRMVVPTEAGRRWGLTGRWRDGWGIDPAEPSEVLGLDDWRLAAAWVKSYGGPRGTGFVRGPTDDPRQVYLLAEYRPAARP